MRSHEQRAMSNECSGRGCRIMDKGGDTMSEKTKTVRGFEDLIAWQKARLLTKTIYEITRKGSFARDFSLAGQIQSASVSIMSNIAEGFERASAKEFHRFLSTSKGSCAEVRSHLYVALDSGHLEATVFQKVYGQAQEVNRIVGGLRASIKRRIQATTEQR